MSDDVVNAFNVNCDQALVSYWICRIVLESVLQG